MDGRAGQVSRSGVPIPLGPTEFEVFYQIVQRHGDVILRGEFLPWQTEKTFPERHPVEEVVSVIRKQLGPVITTKRGRGYCLSPGLGVKTIPSPSLPELKRLLSRALAQLNTHTSAGFRGTIVNCQELIRQGQTDAASIVIALANINLGHAGFCREPWDLSIQRAREVVAGALEAFPKFGPAYAMRGLIQLLHDYNWKQAESDFNEALRLSPDDHLGHSFIAHLLVSQGLFEEGLPHAERAAALQYEHPIDAITVPWLMLLAGRADRALIIADKVVERFSESAPVHVIRGHIYRAVGLPKRAIEEYELALKIDFLPDAVVGKGFVYGQEKRPADALACLDELREAKKNGMIVYTSDWHDALVYAGIGEKAQAIAALERAYEEKCDWLIHLAVEPRWDELRNEPKFQDLVSKVGIRRI